MPTLHIYLKNVPKKFEKEVFTEGGKSYLIFHRPEIEPMPDISEDLIECVTMLDPTIYGIWRKQGVYTHDKARLVVKTHMSSTKDGMFFQSMKVSGPTPTSVFKIHSLVCQGKLYPTEDYEAPQVSPKAPLRKLSIFCRLKFQSLNVQNFFKNLIKRLKVRGLKVWDFFKSLKTKK